MTKMNNLQEILRDIVNHTHSLGLPMIKIVTDKQNTKIESVAPDRSIVLYATTHQVYPDFFGTLGFSNMEKLEHHLKNPEYQENANIKVVNATRNDVTYPDHIYFENATGDFRNEYRFVHALLIDQKMKGVSFQGAKWVIDFKPTPESIKRLKLQSSANKEEKKFQVKTERSNLVIYFGSAASHVGSFVFQPDVQGILRHAWSWPVEPVMNILNLDGEKTMFISDSGAMKIEVDSGLGVYDYIIPATNT